MAETLLIGMHYVIVQWIEHFLQNTKTMKLSVHAARYAREFKSQINGLHTHFHHSTKRTLKKHENCNQFPTLTAV